MTWQLTEDALFLQCQVANKTQAIQLAAASLEQAGYVSSGFLAGMLAREKEVSTYIGAGIAFPHCSQASRETVLRSGFQVFQFPRGVSWGAGKVAFVVVAVAATDNAHIALLATLADLLGDEVKTTLLANAKTKQEFIDYFVKESI
ncbi:PTS sugar transporter subunit IIA [Enterobacterales bacterium CwR94]|nr:PTS sugar transporter subunit IIA [Enterobacterales bacterium CwR94]